MEGPSITVSQLWKQFVWPNREVVEGQRVCRASVWKYLDDQGIEPASWRRKERRRLTLELEAREWAIRDRNTRRLFLLRN